MPHTDADFPARPQCVSYGPDGSVIASYDFAGGAGFTKREEAALRILQGLLAYSTRYQAGPHASEDWQQLICQEAFEIADAFFQAAQKPRR